MQGPELGTVGQSYRIKKTVKLEELFSTRGDSAHQGLLGNVWKHFRFHNLGVGSAFGI